MTARSSPPLVWPGGAALSRFRLEKLLLEVRALVPGITGIAARFLHIIDLAEPLTAHAAQTLHDLLEDGSAPGAELADAQLLVLPRTGL